MRFSSRLFVTVITVFLILPHTPVISAPSLWLPISYHSHYPQLLKAGEKVENDSQCQQLLSGTLAETASTPQQPVFTFRCRTAERKVFTVQVPAHTMELQYTADRWRQQEEVENQEKLRQKLAKRKQYWAVCEQAFKEKTHLFNQAKIITPMPIRPEISADNTFTYHIEFQTMSLQKKPLSYMATAVIETLESCTIQIRLL